MTEQRWADLVHSAVGGPVTSGTMFGSRGLRTGRKFFATWWHGQLVLKLPPARVQELVASEDADPFEPMPGRAMKGWVVVGDGVDWSAAAAEARAYVEAQQH